MNLNTRGRIIAFYTVMFAAISALNLGIGDGDRRASWWVFVFGAAVFAVAAYLAIRRLRASERQSIDDSPG